MFIWLYCVYLCMNLVVCFKDPNFIENRTTIVHLFEWKWKDIALECENFLGPKGYAGVQISPPNENLVVADRPWWERYQPVSYVLKTRSGNETDFKDMTTRCNAVGVRIYVDVVINHMTGGNGIGTAGNIGNATYKYYPAVPYTEDNFHSSCSITNYMDPWNVRNCELVGLRDLNHTQGYVRDKIVHFMNTLLDLGVAGFRVDAAKHMNPTDLKTIYDRLNNLNTKHGFKQNSKPFIYQEVIDYGNEGISRDEYTSLGAVLEFKYGASIGNVFQRNDKLTYTDSWGEKWAFLPKSADAVVFVDNHDTQRGDDKRILTYKKSREYKMAVAFMLAHPYGTPRIMSSYDFNNRDVGPPKDADGNIISPGFRPDDTCTNGYICEHRWRQIYNMVKFRNVVKGTSVENWWSNGDQQISFCRGNRGFVAFTNGGDLKRDLKTCLPKGLYCDIISGNIVNGMCTGKIINVNEHGNAFIILPEWEGVVAIHINSII